CWCECGRADGGVASFPTRRSSDLGADTCTADPCTFVQQRGGGNTSQAVPTSPRVSYESFTDSAIPFTCKASHGLTQRLCIFMRRDRKSTRLNSSHVKTSYAVFCLK